MARYLKIVGSFLLAASLLGGTALGAPPLRDTGLDALMALLELERRSLGDDVDEIERLASRVARATDQRSRAVSRLATALRDVTADRGFLQSAEDEAAEAQARLSAEEARRQAALDRGAERLRRIASLREEITRRRALVRPSDPLTGRWDLTVNPQSRKGVMRLVLDGALVSGDYTLDGGFRGSLRGTFVADKLTLQRIDSERGIDATFYGRLLTDRKLITGTWEATQIAPAIGATAGTFTARLLPEEQGEDR